MRQNRALQKRALQKRALQNSAISEAVHLKGVELFLKKPASVSSGFFRFLQVFCRFLLTKFYGFFRFLPFSSGFFRFSSGFFRNLLQNLAESRRISQIPLDKPQITILVSYVLYPTIILTNKKTIALVVIGRLSFFCIFSSIIEQLSHLFCLIV